jgi:hypothetical protein
MGDMRIRGILPDLRRICAEGESLLEAYSVVEILGSGDEAREEESGLQFVLFNPVSP